MKITEVTERFAVAPQVQVADMQDAADAGYRTVICNRPDGEEDGQPTVAEYLVDVMGLEVSATDADGLRPLHFAAAAGQLGVAETLFRRGAEGTAVGFSAKRSADLRPLHLATVL